MGEYFAGLLFEFTACELYQLHIGYFIISDVKIYEHHSVIDNHWHECLLRVLSQVQLELSEGSPLVTQVEKGQKSWLARPSEQCDLSQRVMRMDPGPDPGFLFMVGN